MTWEYSGIVARLEPKPTQVSILQEVGSEATIMINADLVNQFLDRGIEANEFESPVVVTTTFADEKLEYWFPERELEVAREFGADAVVPCDCPVYRDESKSFRRETVENYVDDLEEIIPEYRNAGIDVIPLVKGESRFERGLCYDMFDSHGISQVGYYCGQYFSYGYRFSALQDRLHQIAMEFDPTDMMLIGLQSENLLPSLPLNVSAAAGKRWLRKINYADGSTSASVRKLEQWMSEVESALEIGQTTLKTYSNKLGWV